MAPRKLSKSKKYFNKKDNNCSECKICKKVVKTAGNTSNCLKHLQRHHAFLFLDCDENVDLSTCENTSRTPASTKTTNILNYMTNVNEYPVSSTHCIELNKALALMIAVDYQPFSVVNDHGFKKFVKILDPRYRLPSDTHIRNKLLPEIYKDLFNKLKYVLSTCEHVSLTTDLWTSVAAEAYITVTCHFVYSTKLRNATLGTVGFYTGHSAENIKLEILKIVNDFEIQDKIVAIVTDNASTMIKACELLQQRHMPCLAHTINLLVLDCLGSSSRSDPKIVPPIPRIHELLKKCKDIVRYFHVSTLAATELSKQLKISNKKDLRLKQESPTRWNSAYEMIQRLLFINTEVSLALINLRNAPSPLNADEREILEDISKILEPFYQATTEISGDYPTSSLVIPIVHGLVTTLTEKETEIQTNIGRELYEKLKAGISKRLFPYETRTVARLSALLDPRIKKYGFRQEENARLSQEILQAEVSRIICATKICVNNKLENSTRHSDNGTSTVSCSTNSNLLSFLEKRKKVADSTATPMSSAIITMRQYSELPLIDKTEDPLLFWEKNINLKPLDQLAKKYLCVPATSVPSERVFSATGYTISDRRSRLKSDTVNMLTFINRNTWLSSAN